MYILKGFMSMPTLADDRKNVTAPFGEFTTYSQTFTRDLRNYKIIEQPDVELYVMHCVDEMLNRITPTASFRANILAFGQWVFQQHVGQLIPAEKNKDTFIRAIKAEFPLMTNVEIGTILESNEQSGYNCPDYVTWRMVDGINVYQLTVWFADTAFRTQYDEYEIELIPPVTDINDLINDKLTVNNILSSEEGDIVDKIQEMVGDLPCTVLFSYNLTWHDPNDFDATLPTKWRAVIWGAAGNDLDIIKDKIRDYLTDNSKYENWPDIYPDLFSETEFTFFPMWGDLALQPNALEVGLYSPMVNVTKLRNHVTTFLPSGYAKTGYMDEHLFTSSVAYRTLAVGVIGNPNNKDEICDLQELYPDVNFALSSTDPDFSRMEMKTQKLCLALNTAMNVAREYDPNVKIETGYSRLVRRGMYYIAFQYEDYTYAILTNFTYKKHTSEQ